MRLPIVALVLLAAAHPAHAAAQRASPDPVAGDTIPAGVTVIEEKDLTVKPALVNRSAITRLLTRSYPQALRGEGTTGRVTVTMVIDPTGVPRLVTVTGSSGVAEFDEASVRRDPRHALLPARPERHPGVGPGARPRGIQPHAVASTSLSGKQIVSA